MRYVSFITDQENAKKNIIEIIKNSDDMIHVCSSDDILTSGKAVGFLSNLNLKNINLIKCFENAVKLSLDQDEDCEKIIFFISEKFSDSICYNIQKYLHLDEKSNIFENYCNFYFITNKELNFHHPRLNVLKKINYKEII